MRTLTILGPKGGVGKSTLATNLLVAARRRRIDAVGLDLDNQASLAVWGAKRATVGAQPDVPVADGIVVRWRQELDALDAALVVVDTPPGMPDEAHRAACSQLALASDLVLIPALPEGPTLVMLGEAGGALRDMGANVLFVLNKVDQRRRATRAARAYLAEYAEVCLVEVPAREHVHQCMHGGRAVVEDQSLGGAEPMLALWADLAARVDVR